MSRCRVRLFAAPIAGVLLVAASPAWAQSPKVAVINLASDQSAGFREATNIRIALEKARNLAPLQNGELQRNLEAPLPADDRDATLLAAARRSLESAREELGNFRKRRALSAIRDGESKAMATPPSAVRRDLLADLAFLAGQVHLSEQNRGLARSSFELAMRLRPDFPAPNPGRFDPDIVAAWKEAQKTAHGKAVASLEVSATYDGVDVFVDGVRVGVTRAEKIPLTAGLHQVTVYSPDYQVANQTIEVGPGDELSISLNLAPQKLHDVALSLRRRAIALGLDRNRPALEGFARKIQELTGASFSIIIRGEGDSLEAIALIPPGLTGARPVSPKATASYIGLFDPLGQPGPDDYRPPLPVRKKWFERTEWQLGLGGGALALITGGVIFAIAATSSDASNRPGVLGGF